MSTRRISPAVALLIVGAACTTWHTESLSPQDLVAAKHPSRVRVGLVSGDRLVIRDRRVVADTLLGIDVTGVRKGPLWPLVPAGRGTPIGLPISQVRAIATRQFSALKTGIAVGGSVAFVIAFAAAVQGACTPSCAGW